MQDNPDEEPTHRVAPRDKPTPGANRRATAIGAGQATIGAVVYNLTSRLVGGVEMTLRETE